MLDERYKIYDLIRLKDVAVTYKAYDIIKKKLVVAKFLDDKYSGNKDFCNRFLEDAKTLETFSHPNLVNVLSAFKGDKLCYLVTEFVKGVALKLCLQVYNRALLLYLCFASVSSGAYNS